jgi:hypothetical protein
MSVSGFSFLRLSTVVLAGLSLPVFAAAQHHGGTAPGGAAPVGRTGTVVVHAVPVAHAGVASVPHLVARPGRTGVATRTHTGVRNARHINDGDNFVASDDQFSSNDVPGLGFDFPHLAAVNGSRHFGRRFFGGAPFFDGGFLFGGPSVIIEQPVEGQAEDAIAGNAVESDPVRRSRRVYEAESNPAPAAEDSAPPREVEQYVFVKSDGGLEFAVAYSWVNGTLRYITPDGKRRTMGRDALDLNATEQFNEQRGIEFHAPA